jgi:hypothetical protein
MAGEGRGRLRRLVAAINLLAVLMAAGATAGVDVYRGGGLEPPDLLEMTGHVGKPTAEEPGGSNLTLGVRYTPQVYQFHLWRMRILNNGILPDQVLFAVEPYDPNFYLFGSAEQLAALASATPADVIIITGYRRAPSRALMLTGLVVTAPTTPSPSPAP